ncbi:MAG: methionine--tRNA ligase [Bacteroidetes bacterium]|nr:methionine--tRNA ligase [Bacteroidota bacterium]
MSTDISRYTITAALPYANGPVHIGHLAGCYLPSDIYARYLRKNEKELIFVCGTDEHGAAINMKAKSEGAQPREIVDRYHEVIRGSLEDIGISFDIFSRTSKEVHHKTAQDFFKKLYDKGSLEEKVTKQYFDEEAAQFIADRFIVGECPNCHFNEAYGDQCENCGTSLSPTDLIEPKSRLSGAAPVLKETKHWFLPLDHLSGKIKDYIQAHENWRPNVYGQCMSWLDAGDGLQARSMTRDLDWGIPVPVEGADGKVLYVWFDAPIGYISATKELKGEAWTDWWTKEDTKLVHFIGKDNIVFHCIIFPAMLMEHGGFHLADEVPANEFLNLEGRKISTSRNWAVWLHEYLEDFPDQQDVLRYVLTATAPESKDNDFTWSDFQTRNNSELVAILGNFVNRVVVLMQKYYGGALPKPNELSPADESVLAEVAEAPANIADSIEKYRFREALSRMMNIARLGNKYLADEEPWKLIKTDPQRTETVMYVAAQVCAQLAQMMEPFMPFSAAKLQASLGMNKLSWSECQNKELIGPGSQISADGHLFSKIEDAMIERQMEKLKTPSESVNYSPLKDEIQFEDFEKLDLRVGTIVKAEKVKKADKLLHLEVDLGFETRSIVSGIAAFFDTEELAGQRVSVVVNLAPRKLRGVVSQGMILMAEDSEGKLKFTAAPEDMPNGAVIR